MADAVFGRIAGRNAVTFAKRKPQPTASARRERRRRVPVSSQSSLWCLDAAVMRSGSSGPIRQFRGRGSQSCPQTYPGLREMRGLPEAPSMFLPGQRRQNDQTGMEFAAANQSPEAPCVFGNDDPVFGDAPLEDTMVRFAAPAYMQRMNRIVTSSCVEPRRQLRREALIDEQLHPVVAQGRPPGRPIRGCVRA
jgi:hypothetical protein